LEKGETYNKTKMRKTMRILKEIKQNKRTNQILLTFM